MYIGNNSGPSTDPCGTPCSIFFRLELTLETDTNCLRLERYNLNQSLATSLIP